MPGSLRVERTFSVYEPTFRRFHIHPRENPQRLETPS